ncbi:MAG: hypothetical protein JSR55_01260 [Proteobacteria bacterium]|nr:hypothetical protein [Pseudomonadota bacterium]
MHSLTIGLGIAAFICGLLALALIHFPAAFVFLFWGIVIVVGVAFERYRYKRIETKAPAGNWQRTTERFIDDATGAPVTVWIDPATGERKYVAD